LTYLILGPLEVRDGETEVALRGGQQRKLLAIMLLHNGEAVSSDRLIDELWHGNPPETGCARTSPTRSWLPASAGTATIAPARITAAATVAGAIGTLIART
jgi:hypothetical protein